MDMAYRNAVQLHVANQLEYFLEYNERPRFQINDDPFQLSERQFVKLFRLKKDTTIRLINIVEEHSAVPLRTSVLNATVQVLTALRFYASDSYQNCVGSNVHMRISQTSVSRCIHNVTNILNLPEVFNTWVYFPNNIQELQEIRNKFWIEKRFPGAIGCIDCTHIAIFPPPKGDANYPEHNYVNRKGYHSINVQLICDPDLRILNVNARYPGSTHDSYIWNNSNILPLMRDIYNCGHQFFLLGDSGYALRPWMMTPMLNDEQNDAILRYNTRQISTRSLIECCNGLLKMRFRCLFKHRVLHYKPDFCSKIINACTVLHNMCIHDKVPVPEGEGDLLDFAWDDVDPIREPDIGAANRNPELSAGRRVRDNLIRRYFQ
ncbi:PREDICTED: putative nuclease HARBI1 [Trachymyrmex cornetzi]|uniref:putative nuclease HARBI1 n=1 Tax=Trachymyrmex cornetzi TaxID=471704 RepID=UPI00084F0709|nr:PREDICTED: putative nuclease HARBI1 [Trachymyrmex cornetzi]